MSDPRALLTARAIHGPYTQLLANLQGDDGPAWLKALKRLNRKENPRWHDHFPQEKTASGLRTLLTVREIHGPSMQLLTNLQGVDGSEWLKALERFNRKEDSCWSCDLLVDLDADPFVPEGSTVEEHLKGGRYLWTTAARVNAVYLKRHWRSRDDRAFVANVLKNLRDQNPINANLLDYLLANPHLLPEEAKKDRLYFWGTTYRLSKYEFLCVRRLGWKQERNKWCWGWYGGLSSVWGDDLYIPVLAAA